jgi:hypothetical protein
MPHEASCKFRQQLREQILGSISDSKRTCKWHMHTAAIWDNYGLQDLKNRLWIKIEFCKLELSWGAQEKQNPYWFYLAVKIDFNIVEMWMLRIKGFPSKFMKFHYIMLWLMCGVLWGQLPILGPFYFSDHKFTHTLHVFWHQLCCYGIILH